MVGNRRLSASAVAIALLAGIAATAPSRADWSGSLIDPSPVEHAERIEIARALLAYIQPIDEAMPRASSWRMARHDHLPTTLTADEATLNRSLVSIEAALPVAKNYTQELRDALTRIADRQAPSLGSEMFLWSVVGTDLGDPLFWQSLRLVLQGDGATSAAASASPDQEAFYGDIGRAILRRIVGAYLSRATIE